MPLSRLLLLLSAVVAVASCKPFLEVEDPICSSAYGACKRACEDMPPPPEAFGPQSMAFSEPCGHRCFQDAQSCEQAARDALRARREEAPAPAGESPAGP